MSDHVSKIDMRHIIGVGGCPFAYMSSVNCARFKLRPGVQYICECDARRPAPKQLGASNES